MLGSRSFVNLRLFCETLAATWVCVCIVYIYIYMYKCLYVYMHKYNTCTQNIYMYLPVYVNT